MEKRSGIMEYTGKRFSILGDSISTFKGVTVDDPNTFYGSVMCQKGGLTGVEDTWWMQVISGLGGVLERDNAYSGSCVTDGYGLGRGACTMERVTALGQPDVILIFMGANDMGFQVPEAAFREAYPLMLSRLRDRYPLAEIWCGTLINGRKVLADEPYFMGSDPTTPVEPFSTIIRQAAAQAGAKVADLACGDLLYDAIDGCHPTSRGMSQLASLWLAAMGQQGR
jgi:lysophospholipase L1-like esterase